MVSARNTQEIKKCKPHLSHLPTPQVPVFQTVAPSAWWDELSSFFHSPLQHTITYILPSSFSNRFQKNLNPTSLLLGSILQPNH